MISGTRNDETAGPGTGGRLADLAVNNSGFAFDPHTGESFAINASGGALLKALGAGETPEAIAARLAEENALALAEARADVRDFIEQLRTLSLLEATPWTE